MGTQLITEKFEPAIKALDLLCHEIAREKDGQKNSRPTRPFCEYSGLQSHNGVPSHARARDLGI